MLKQEQLPCTKSKKKKEKKKKEKKFCKIGDVLNVEKNASNGECIATRPCAKETRHILYRKDRSITYLNDIMYKLQRTNKSHILTDDLH